MQNIRQYFLLIAAIVVPILFILITVLISKLQISEKYKSDYDFIYSSSVYQYNDSNIYKYKAVYFVENEKLVKRIQISDQYRSSTDYPIYKEVDYTKEYLESDIDKNEIFYPTLYRYDFEKDEPIVISFEETSEFKLNLSSLSKDKYMIERGYNIQNQNNSFMPFYSGDNYNDVFIVQTSTDTNDVKGGQAINRSDKYSKLNIDLESGNKEFIFLGWIE